MENESNFFILVTNYNLLSLQLTSTVTVPARRKSFDEQEQIMRRKLGSELTNRSSKCQSVIMLSPSSQPSDDENKIPVASPALLIKVNEIVCFALILHEMVCCTAGRKNILFLKLLFFIYIREFSVCFIVYA